MFVATEAAARLLVGSLNKSSSEHTQVHEDEFGEDYNNGEENNGDNCEDD